MRRITLITIAILLIGCVKKKEEVKPLRKIRPPEGMVLIPGGKFLMGSENPGESPPHLVEVDSFYLDKYEVTNREYKEFVDSTGHPKPPYFNDPHLNKPDQPVVGVSYYDALSYAEWRGKRLPTEAEWEWAARGGLEGPYPWGKEPPDKTKANYAPGGEKGLDGYEWTAPVGSFPPNGYGLYDMAGNVWEWCQDIYHKEYPKSFQRNPKGPDSGYTHVLRGGSWLSTKSKYLRVTSRLELKPFVKDRYYGFRCAKDL